MRTRITVLIPVKHFHEGFLRRAVASVFAQTSPRWKLLIVGDKGNTGVLAELLSNELRDPRAKLVPQAGRRLGGALNTGMRAATTTFVAILLGDDLWAENAIEALEEFIARNPRVDFFHSARIFIDENDRPISSVYYNPASFEVQDFTAGSPVKHLLCWRRRMGLAVGGIDETLDHGADDWDFPWTMADHGAVFRTIPEPLYRLRDHRESFRLTTHVPLSHQTWALRKILRKHGVSADRIRQQITKAEETYLQQSLFKTARDKVEKEAAGIDARAGWREPFR